MKEAFLLGAATAAHQVEGNNTGNDCWAQEQMEHGGYQEKSGLACDHYHRYKEDIHFLKEAGCNAFRFSIEWARIEPQEGVFDDHEIEHYRNVIDCCRSMGLEPLVTLHHFSTPVWVIRKGGWEAESTVRDFAAYVTYVMKKLGSDLKYICTINEANMGLQIGKMAKQYMNQIDAASKASCAERAQMGINLDAILKDMAAAAEENRMVFGVEQPHCFTLGGSENSDRLIMKAHQAAKNAIKSLYPNIQVGLSLSLHAVEVIPGGESMAKAFWEEEFSHYLPYIYEDDFLGVQNYTVVKIGPEGELPPTAEMELTQMGYPNAPEALEKVLRCVSKLFHKDLIVTENGIATEDDEKRCDFIRKAAKGVRNCIRDGIPVKGYFYWSLLDNFEWQLGYSKTFGLIAIDRQSMERSPKASLFLLNKAFQTS